MRFARTASNWINLDELLDKIVRPLKPEDSSDFDEDSGFFDDVDIFAEGCC